MMLILQMMLEFLWVGFFFVCFFLKQSDCLVLTSFAVYTTCTAEGSLRVTTAVQLLHPTYN